MVRGRLGWRVARLQARLDCRDYAELRRQERSDLAFRDPVAHCLLWKGAWMVQAYLRLHPELEALRGKWDALLPAFDPVMREALCAVMRRVEERVDLLQSQGIRACDQPGLGVLPWPELPEFLRVQEEAAFGLRR